MRLDNRRVLVTRYGVALLIVAALFVLKQLVGATGIQMQDSPFLLGLGAVAVSAWFGGRGPGVFATLLSGSLTSFYYFSPGDSLYGHNWDANIKISLFLLEGMLVSVVGGALKQSEARKTAILDTATDAIITMDDMGRIVDFNPAAERIFGRLHATVVGQEMAALIIPERLRGAHRDGLRQYLATGQWPELGQQVEFPVLRSDGSEFPAEIVIMPITTEGPPLFTSFIRDLTQRRQMEERLTYEDQVVRLNEQIKTISDPTISFDDVMQKCLGLVCKAAGSPVGHIYWPDENGKRLISSKLWFLTDPNAFQSLREVTEAMSPLSPSEGLPGRVWKTGRPALIENIARDDNFPQSCQSFDLGIKGAFAFPILIGDEIVAVMEFFTPEELIPNKELLNLTRNVGEQLERVIERRRALEQQARLAAIVDSSYDPIVGKSLDGMITSWNRAAERGYGYTADEAIGQPISITLPPDNAEVEAELRAAIRSGRRLEQFETVRRHRDGQLIPVSLTLSPIRDSAGKLIGSSAIERDISRRKQAEQELREAKDAAIAANRAKSDFLANVSHELRTPMNAVLGMLQLGLGEELSPVMRNYLGTAKESADALMFLLNDILDFSRMEAGQFKLELAPFRLREVLDGTIKTLSLRAHEKGLELACQVHRDTPEFLFGDRHRLRQIVINLVGNAIKFTERGEVVVDVRVEPGCLDLENRPTNSDDKDMSRTASSNAVTLHLTVTDTGIGIAPADQATIFAPFTQVDASTTRKYGGTGLGLTICHELIELMGGQIWVESEPGRGSQFHFTACFEIAPTAAPIPETATLIAELREQPVLVVDDNRTNRLILEDLLSSWGMRPTTVSDADAALSLLKDVQLNQQQFPLILIDALMPGKDGFQLADEILHDHRWPGAVILMLSSADRQVFSDRLKDLEIAAYLEKPVSQSDLLEAIQRALHGLHEVLPARETPIASPQPLHVLLVEDTPANQKVIQAILDKRGHHITLAQNGREAVELVTHHEFDVVLMDIQMPTMDGLQATAAIRNLDSPQSHIPIIAMTAHALKSDQERFLAAGMDDCLTKPIDAERVIELVEQYGARSAVAGSSLAGPITRDEVSQSGQPYIPTLNRDAALRRMGGDEILYQKMVRYFLEDSPGLAEQMRVGLRDNDAESLIRAAHSLKGLVANFDAHPALAAASRVEEIGHSGNLDAAAAALTDLEFRIDELSLTLREMP